MKYLVACNFCESTNLMKVRNSKDGTEHFKCLNCDEDMPIEDIDFTEINENQKERCTACNGSGWYDACDKAGNPIPCGACDGSGFEVD